MMPMLSNQKRFESYAKGIERKDIYKVGDIAERNALLMHSTLLSLDLWYFYRHH